MSRGPSFWFDTRVYLGVAAALTAVIFFYNRYIAVLGMILLWSLYMYGRDRSEERQRALTLYIKGMAQHIEEGSIYAVEHLPVAIAIVDGRGIIHWFNQLLAEWSGGEIEAEDSILEAWPELPLDKMWGKDGTHDFQSGINYYQVVYRMLDSVPNEESMMVLYITDTTDHETIKAECLANQPVLAYIDIDNYDDALKGLNENQRAAILAEVGQLLVDWMSDLDGFLKKYGDGQYLAVLKRQGLERALEEKFDVLDRVREVRGGNKIPVTLSIGVAADEPTIAALTDRAQAGLDLALGRGGDQAAVHIDGKMQFYGGKAKTVEKNTRVKARVVAQAIRESINDVDVVLIMGHSGEDFDSLGATLGLAKMAKFLEKPTYIVVSHTGSSLEKLTELLEDYEEYDGLFISGQQAEDLLGGKTLLFVVDTHRPGLTAAPELLQKVEKVIVVDHHRRAEEFIANPLLVYLEPSASSTSELVAELLMYFDDKLDLTRLEATAMYAGIVVDTKNFAVQTGVRTFDAASYLRRAGADPTLVKSLFTVDFDNMRLRSEIISSAQMFPGGVIIAKCPRDVKNGQVLAAQSADSLLNIEGVKVTFVLFQTDVGIGVSARSQGEINVQVILEKLGGGGHQTVAGAQVKNMTMEEAKNKIMELVVQYVEEGGL